MFEITLETNGLHEEHIENAKQKLLNKIKRINGIIVTGNNNGRAFLSIAVPKNFAEDVKFLLLDTVSEMVVSLYKRDFLNENLTFEYLSPETREILISTLVAFDKASDVDFVKKNLVLGSVLVLDSFFHFKLSELKDRWVHVAGLVSANLPNLASNGSVFDMMKFLISSTPCKTAEVCVQCVDDFVVLVVVGGENNGCGRQFCLNDQKDGDKLLLSLIELVPKKILVPNEIKNKFSIFDKIQELFAEKIIIT